MSLVNYPYLSYLLNYINEKERNKVWQDIYESILESERQSENIKVLIARDTGRKDRNIHNDVVDIVNKEKCCVWIVSESEKLTVPSSSETNNILISPFYYNINDNEDRIGYRYIQRMREGNNDVKHTIQGIINDIKERQSLRYKLKVSGFDTFDEMKIYMCRRGGKIEDVKYTGGSSNEWTLNMKAFDVTNIMKDIEDERIKIVILDDIKEEDKIIIDTKDIDVQRTVIIDNKPTPSKLKKEEVKGEEKETISKVEIRGFHSLTDVKSFLLPYPSVSNIEDKMNGIYTCKINQTDMKDARRKLDKGQFMIHVHEPVISKSSRDSYNNNIKTQYDPMAVVLSKGKDMNRDASRSFHETKRSISRDRDLYNERRRSRSRDRYRTRSHSGTRRSLSPSRARVRNIRSTSRSRDVSTRPRNIRSISRSRDNGNYRRYRSPSGDRYRRRSRSRDDRYSSR